MDFRIEPIRISETNEIQKLSPNKKMSSQDIEDLEKFYLVQKNNAKVLHMNRREYQALLKKRPLLRYRPLKNSFVKKGDEKLLAFGLGIEESQLNKYIDNAINNTESLDEEKTSMVQDYVYRHGTKEQALAWLKKELSDTGAVLRRLYRTLEKSSGGIYDYFERPCHLLDNQTAYKIHTIIKYRLDDAQQKGVLTEDVNKTACDWALRQIYNIQSNQKVREALKITKYNG